MPRTHPRTDVSGSAASMTGTRVSCIGGTSTTFSESEPSCRETGFTFGAEGQGSPGVDLDDHLNARDDDLGGNHGVVRQFKVALVRYCRDLAGIASHDHAVNLVCLRPP